MLYAGHTLKRSGSLGTRLDRVTVSHVAEGKCSVSTDRPQLQLHRVLHRRGISQFKLPRHQDSFMQVFATSSHWTTFVQSSILLSDITSCLIIWSGAGLWDPWKGKDLRLSLPFPSWSLWSPHESSQWGLQVGAGPHAAVSPARNMQMCINCPNLISVSYNQKSPERLHEVLSWTDSLQHPSAS